MPVTVTLELNGAPVPVMLDDEALVAIAAQVRALASQPQPNASSYLTVQEAAELLRCSKQRVYDLRNSRRLSALNEGGRALLLRSEVEALVSAGTVRRR